MNGIGLIASVIVVIGALLSIPIKIVGAVLRAPMSGSKTVRTFTKRVNNKGEVSTMVSVRRTSEE